VRRQRQELAGTAARLRVVEGGREVSLDERWHSKFAELLTAQGAELPAQPQDGDTRALRRRRMTSADRF